VRVGVKPDGTPETRSGAIVCLDFTNIAASASKQFICLALQIAMRLAATTFLIVLELAIAILIGSGLLAVGLGGAAWILGGILAGAIVFSTYRFKTEQPLQPNRTARKIGQTIVGLAIGLSLQHDYLDTIAAHLPVLIGLPIYLVIGCGGIGWLYARLEKIDLLTAFLATTPGNIGVMASLAADYGKNTPLVSLVQLMRFTAVIFIMPLIAKISTAHLPTIDLTAFVRQVIEVPPSELLLSSAILGITLVVVYWGNTLKIPMAAFLGAIAIGLLFDNAPLFFSGLPAIDLQLPLAFNLIGQILLGITIGEYWGMNPLLKLTTIGRTLIPISFMFGIAFLAAKMIQLVTDWNWLTCLLMAAPGGSPEMIWIALTLHQDTELITTGHIIRLLLINLSLPLLITLGDALNLHEKYLVETSIQPSPSTISSTPTPSDPS
jgi:uncharacterized protein